MMLWYKAWRESRTLFLLSAVTIAGLCVCFVLYHDGARSVFSDEPPSYAAYIWRATYKTYLRELFEVLVLLLGVGGLLRERAYGTAAFTLSLPVSRWRLIWVRAAVGWIEVAALASLPLLVIPALSPVVQRSYPFSQALQFSLLWMVGGGALFAIGFLSSMIVGGEYSAPVVSLIAVLMYSVIADLPGLERYLIDIHDVMSGAGMSYFQPASSLLTGPLPWGTLAVILLVALSLVASAAHIAQKQDF